MVSLNKNNQTAIDYVTNFINGQWLENNIGGFQYYNIGYNNINAEQYRIFCLLEQENVCCYCSREIDNNPHTQLEHIIPRSIDTEDALEPYFDLSNILANNIVLQEDFRLSIVRQITPPFPHHIAYQNIVASCNGKTFKLSEDFTCCNHNRGNDFVPPFNLMPNSIRYEKDGTIYYVDDEIDNRYIKPLNLNKGILKSIRRIWFLFANSDVTENELANVNNEEAIIETISLHLEVNPFKSMSDRNVIDSFKTLSNWGTLMKYRYFLNYFRTNNI